ncbi:thioredoxin TrxC [Xanthomonas massiliensis]|jgi:thioredoxin 2|uniref:thioredoxin TrxC n=1 Tax=Xanthomonas massiliensis TaxID=1720302 RepID=UPI00082597C1|nr:thioredoxin TrxC [Xanthomonas massiliensis]
MNANAAATLQVPCPHCQAINRVPAARLAQHPNCGRCHRPLFEGLPITLDATNFDLHASRADLPLVVDFWAPWCGPCRMMAPAYAQAAALLEPKVRLGKLDTEANPVLATRFDIRSIPTMAVFLHGREIARHSGAIPLQAIVQWVNQHAA